LKTPLKIILPEACSLAFIADGTSGRVAFICGGVPRS
jgi:hypothetical protein